MLSIRLNEVNPLFPRRIHETLTGDSMQQICNENLKSTSVQGLSRVTPTLRSLSPFLEYIISLVTAGYINTYPSDIPPSLFHRGWKTLNRIKLVSNFAQIYVYSGTSYIFIDIYIYIHRLPASHKRLRKRIYNKRPKSSTEGRRTRYQDVWSRGISAITAWLNYRIELLWSHTEIASYKARHNGKDHEDSIILQA